VDLAVSFFTSPQRGEVGERSEPGEGVPAIERVRTPSPHPSPHPKSDISDFGTIDAELG